MTGNKDFDELLDKMTLQPFDNIYSQIELYLKDKKDVPYESFIKMLSEKYVLKYKLTITNVHPNRIMVCDNKDRGFFYQGGMVKLCEIMDNGANFRYCVTDGKVFYKKYDDDEFPTLTRKLEKPPIGLIPKRFAIEDRYKEVCGAISRYYEAGLQIPVEWIEEYNELVIQIKFKD